MWRVCDTKRADEKSSTAQHSTALHTLRRATHRLADWLWVFGALFAGRLWVCVNLEEIAKKKLETKHYEKLSSRRRWCCNTRTALTHVHPPGPARTRPAQCSAVQCRCRSDIF